ncbi:MAG: lipopolysaccharide heptosyltransferase II [Candidatus Omnitrophota bacterium]
MKTKKKILIVNVNWLGDVLFSTPLIRAIRHKNPDAHIACMVIPRCYQILEGNPHLDELIIYDEEGAHKGVLGKLKFASVLRRIKFDEAIILHRSLTRAFLVALAKVPKRVGYYTKKRGFLLTDKPMAPEGQIHRMDLFCELGQKLGVEVKDRYPEFYITDPDRQYVEKILKEAGIEPKRKMAVLNPGGNWNPKRWPKEQFAKLANALVDKYGFDVVISGSGKDIPLGEEIKKLSGVKVFIACGRTNLKQLGALMEAANIVISNDSGPLHIAAAMGATTVALFGPTSPKITGPRAKSNVYILQKEVGCRIPCYSLMCRNNRCMKAITVEDVCKCIEKYS